MSKELPSLYIVEYMVNSKYEKKGFNRKKDTFEFAENRCSIATKADDVIVRIAERDPYGFPELQLIAALKGEDPESIETDRLRIYRVIAMCPPKRDIDIVIDYTEVEAIGMPDADQRIKMYYKDLDTIAERYFSKKITVEEAEKLADEKFQKYFIKVEDI